MNGGLCAPAGPGLRLARALVLTGSSLGLGALAHDHAGAAATLGPGSGVATLVILALAWIATARQVTWPFIAAILGTGQLLTHLALSAGHLTGAASGGHAHHGAAAPLDLPVATGHSDARMLLLHAGAGIVLTIVFTVGERALWSTVARLLVTWSAPLLPLPAPRLLPAAIPLAASSLAHHRPLGRAPPLR